MNVQRTCECCRKSFPAKSADVKRGWARFCSKRCKAIQQTQDSRDDNCLDHQSWGAHNAREGDGVADAIDALDAELLAWSCDMKDRAFADIGEAVDKVRAAVADREAIREAEIHSDVFQLVEAATVALTVLPDTEECCGVGQWGGNPNEPPQCCGMPLRPRADLVAAIAMFRKEGSDAT